MKPRRLLKCWCWPALILLLSAGCGNQPQIAKPNVRLIEELRTAVSSKKVDWLESTAKQMETARKKGRLSSDEYAAMEPIVAAGRQGQWVEANEQITKLIKGQSH